MSCLRGVLASQRPGELLGDRLDIGKVERSRESRRGPHTHDRNIGSIHRLLEGVARVIEKFGRLDRHDLTTFVQHRRDGGDGLPRLEDADYREARIPMVSLSHGSATLDASAAMLKHYSRATGSVPEQVVLIIGKDDLNLGGYRAEKSRRYLTYRSGVVRKLEDFPALSHAGRSTTSQWSSIFKKRLAQVVGSVSERNDVSLIYHWEMPPEVETLLRSLARDYTFDFGAFQHVDVLQRELKIKAVSVVLLPCTDRYVEFHDLTNPKSPYAAIRKEIRDTCRLHGFSFLDLGDATSQHELFSDPYHPNTKGRDVITARMKVWMKAHLNSGTLEPDD